MFGLSYEEDTDTSVNITWNPPKEPNGDIVAYFVEHGVYNKESTIEVRVDPSRPRFTVIKALDKNCHSIVAMYFLFTFINKLKVLL